MASALRFEIEASSGEHAGRVGTVTTPHGSFQTPAFMPVGTRATIKGLTPDQVQSTGAQIVLANAYHLMLRPGEEVIAAQGGLHDFMRWDGPILTDSGGYQAWSMADINSLDDEGVTFSSIVDGSSVRLTPERSIAIQQALGADIIMAFDDCPPSTIESDGRARLEAAVDRTAAWLERCVAAHAGHADQALLGIVQGGTDLDLRRRSADQVCSMDLPGYAIGGVAVGESTEDLHRIAAATAAMLPVDRPRYLMGVGYERDLVAAAAAGIDMFDCVLPTRHGRNANAFTRNGPLHLRNACFADDPRPIDESCNCLACSGGFGRSYIRHLYLAKEMLAGTLVSVHNLHHFQVLMLDIRTAIRDDSWSLLKSRWPVLACAGTTD